MSIETSTATAQPAATRTLLGLHLLVLSIGALQFAFVPSALERPVLAAAALALSTFALLAVRIVPVMRSASRQHAIEIAAMTLAIALLAVASGGAHSALVPLNIVPLAALAVAYTRWWPVLAGSAVLAGLGFMLGALTPDVDVKSPDFGISLLSTLAPGTVIAVVIVGFAQDVQDAGKRIRVLATTDPLTGLLNSRSFEQLLQQEHRRSERLGRSYSIITVGVHNLAEVNETLGHQAGALLLKAVASAITRSIRSTDVAARLGNDDFVVLCMVSNPDVGAAIAQRIRNNAYASTVSIANRLVRANVSVGAANYPADHLSPKDLLVIATRRIQQDRERS